MDYDVPGLKSSDADEIEADDEEKLLHRMQQFVELNRIRDDAWSNSNAAQMKQKLRYDKKHAAAGPPLEVGEEVLVKNSRREQRKGDKQQPLYTGPFVVEELTDAGALRIKGRKNVVAVSNVKRYLRADQSKNLNAKESIQVKDIKDSAEVEKEPAGTDEEIIIVADTEDLDDCELPMLDPVPNPISAAEQRKRMLSITTNAATMEFVPVDRNWQRSRAAALNFRLGKSPFAQAVTKTVNRHSKPQQMRAVRGISLVLSNSRTLFLLQEMVTASFGPYAFIFADQTAHIAICGIS